MLFWSFGFTTRFCRVSPTMTSALEVDEFLFVFKTKFRRTFGTTAAAVLLLSAAALLPAYARCQTDVALNSGCADVECGSGVCVNGTCVCHDGWQGPQCQTGQYCGSKVNFDSQCKFYRTCTDCRDDPEYGWCDDGSGTGLGTCMTGGNTPPQSCSQNKWYFKHCPTCQCNGHSTCMNNTDICIHPCSNNTEGPNCETCIKGYYGNPVNGGECKECKCNNQGNHCNNENGKCYCSTKGIIGDNCEKCDTNNHYLGDPSNHGSCFYDLTIDYHFTFNLSKKDDLRFTQINFQNSPSKSDVDADFSITCSVTAKMNITVRPAYGPEKMLLPSQNCTNFRTKFLKSEYMFGTYGNMSLTTFYVYVYDFKPPLWIQISFSQYSKLNH